MLEFEKDNFFIHKEVNNYLQTIVKNKIFSNGYIFFGAEGVGKKQTAFKFIKDIFAQYQTSGNIEDKIKHNNHPDLLLIEPTSFTKNKMTTNMGKDISKKNNTDIIKIEQIRNIKNFLSQRSIESEKKIVLIYDAHLLNEAASNCLLKTLEEPSNGIFILLTSKFSSLLDTVKSRCQLIRFRSFSKKQIEILLKKIDSSKLEIVKKLNLQDLVNSGNGSPGNILKKIEMWSEISDEIINKLDLPLRNTLEIFKVSKLITEELEIHQQIYLIQLIQQIWWSKTKNINLIKKLDNLKSYINNSVQPRLSWEITLLKISLEEL